MGSGKVLGQTNTDEQDLQAEAVIAFFKQQRKDERDYQRQSMPKED
jgi:hypothetical protein